MNIHRLQYLKPLLEEEIKQGREVGISVAVLYEDSTVYRENFGYANRERKMKVQNDTIFRLYSMTKPITSTAMMILLERGMIDLLDPVSMYLDGFKNQKVYENGTYVDVNRDVTIRDLLSMSSGLMYPDETNVPGRKMQELFDEVQKTNEEGGNITTLEFCNRIGQQPLIFQPGTTWHYGTSADICGAIIEVVTGMKLSEFYQKEIFEPLGMEDTGFYVSKEKHGRFAELYEMDEATQSMIPCLTRTLALTKCLTPPAFESGGAGLVSTLDDYTKFASMLMYDGEYQGKRILSKRTIEFMNQYQMTTEQVAQAGWDGNIGYAYGNFMRVFDDPGKAFCMGRKGEFGWDGWAGTYFFVNREKKIAMVYLVQHAAGGNAKLMRKARNIIYSTLDEE